MSSIPTVAPYGTWKSLVSAEMVVDGAVSLDAVALDPDHLYWIEGRPSEGGRRALMRESTDGILREAVPVGYDVATRVHEYGGGALALHDGVLYFSHAGDGRVYRQCPGLDPEPLTQEDYAVRYADLTLDWPHRRLLAVRERRDGDSVEHAVVAIPLDNPDTVGEVLVSGRGFYMFPRVSPDGGQLAWIQWDHPQIPWDSCELLAAPVDAEGTVGGAETVAGGPNESIFQPEWSPDNRLYFVSDRTGWWNLHVWHEGQVHPVTALRAEFGEAAWVFGLSTYGFLSDAEILATYSANGVSKLVRINTRTREMDHLPCPFATLSHIQVQGNRAIMIAGADRSPQAVVAYQADTRRFRIVRRASRVLLDEDNLSLPEPIEFPNPDGSMSYGFYYAPKNRDYIPPEGERPPLVVTAHGGPADRAVPEFQLETQYWTTRGFAVIDVNYGGSTGYGRAFRDRLKGRWGEVDVDDVVSAGLFLARYGLADADRLIIRGSSSGGYTALAALAFRDAFRVGSVYYGITDLTLMAQDTHNFESRYLDWLVGPVSDTARYRDRSPLAHAESIRVPVIFFHGREDRVVPLEQTRLLADKLASQGVPVAHLAFDGEGHGLGNPMTAIQCLEAELYLYAKVLNLRLPERVDPVPIDNWESPAR